jgi:hypothetical protein
LAFGARTGAGARSPEHLALAVVAAGFMQMSFTASAQPFQPISQLTTWYTDRNPIDVEIIASAGQGNEARRIEPERILRLLQDAYWRSSDLLGFLD